MLTSLESFRRREGARLKSPLYRAVISLQIVEENISCPKAQHLFLRPAARYFVAQDFNVQIFHFFPTRSTPYKSMPELNRNQWPILRSETNSEPFNLCSGL